MTWTLLLKEEVYSPTFREVTYPGPANPPEGVILIVNKPPHDDLIFSAGATANPILKGVHVDDDAEMISYRLMVPGTHDGSRCSYYLREGADLIDPLTE